MTALPTSIRNHVDGRRRAFSFAELVIVVLVLGILAAVAIPKYQDALSLRHLQSATNRLVADIKLAKSVAMTKSENQVIFVDTTKSSYELENYIDSQSDGSVYSVDLTEAPYRSTIVSSDYDDADQPLSFNGFGIPGLPGQMTLRSGKFTQQITISVTGAISIQAFVEDTPATQHAADTDADLEVSEPVTMG